MSIKVKEVKAYKTSEGKLFLHRKEALEAERVHLLGEAINAEHGGIFNIQCSQKCIRDWIGRNLDLIPDSEKVKQIRVAIADMHVIQDDISREEESNDHSFFAHKGWQDIYQDLRGVTGEYDD